PQGLDGYVSLADVMYRQDVDKAKEYMKKAGFPDGGFALDYVLVAGHPEETKIGLILKDCLSKIGIEVKIVPVPWPEMCALGSTAETSPDIMAVYTTPIINDPDVVASQYHPDSYGAYYASHFYYDRKVIELVDEARSISDWEEREKLYEQIQRMVLEDAPEVFGMLYSRVWAFRDHVKGFRFSPVRFTSEIDMYWLYIEE
ncbi:ABC transporter substrate-binding protein, partial [Candidatus Bipolaricaulota bacterium]|nr:ABC transporter substrate-binding protein [Candidatus Bipolaricaulota bacterium]